MSDPAASVRLSMGGHGRRIAVYPDSERVEAALCRAAVKTPFVDATGTLSFSQFLDRFEPAKRLGRRSVTSLTARVLVHLAAMQRGGGPFKAFVKEPAFARAALELFFDLKSGRLDPAELKASIEAMPAGRKPRARYLAELFESYEGLLAKHQLADREDLVKAVLEQVK